MQSLNELKDAVASIKEKTDDIEKNIEFSTRLDHATYQLLLTLKDLILQEQTVQIQRSHPNPLNRCGRKCFSQTDEDGITLEIIRRLKIETGTYAEFGVGNGLENNTIILASLGWKGFWVGGEDLNFSYAASDSFLYIKDWITLANVASHTKQGLTHLNTASVDVASLDLDGNDIHFVKHLLENGFLPKVFIVEYNGKFPPPVKFEIEYDPEHRWVGDDYFGASLSSFVELFDNFGYTLICCNAHTGANAFFIRNEYLEAFDDVPKDINQIYVSPRYHLYTKHGHNISSKVVETMFKR